MLAPKQAGREGDNRKGLSLRGMGFWNGSVFQVGFEVVYELTGDAAGAASVLALPLQGTLLQQFVGNIEAALAGEFAYDV